VEGKTNTSGLRWWGDRLEWKSLEWKSLEWKSLEWKSLEWKSLEWKSLEPVGLNQRDRSRPTGSPARSRTSVWSVASSGSETVSAPSWWP